jgi:hypothetical protein
VEDSGDGVGIGDDLAHAGISPAFASARPLAAGHQVAEIATPAAEGRAPGGQRAGHPGLPAGQAPVTTASPDAYGCVVCGGALHRGNFSRKTRGFGPGIDAECLAGEPGPDLRLSFCCEREGCRTRHTPASMRFLGRRVYAAIVVVLAMVLCQAGARAPGPASALGVSRRKHGGDQDPQGERSEQLRAVRFSAPSSTSCRPCSTSAQRPTFETHHHP